MQRQFLFIIFLALIIMSGSSYAQYDTLRCSEMDRTYLLHVPPSYNHLSSMPLVVALHNAYGSASNFQSMTGFSTKADTDGFIVVYPNGTGNPTSWNAGGCCFSAVTNNVDDVGFISALIDTLKHNYNIDTTRIYAAGFSNGSIMAYRLAAELSTKIIAIAAVSGQMMLDEINPAHPVPIIHFHALDDNAVPYLGGVASGCNFPSVESVIDIWMGINNCITKPDTFVNNKDVTGTKWAVVNNPADIVLYTTPTGGHSWPKKPISATDTIWNFFTTHPPQAATNVIHHSGNTIPHFILDQNYPNPFNPSTRITYSISQSDFVTLKIYDAQGREIYILVNEIQKAGEYTLNFNANKFASGFYFYKLKVGNDFIDTKKMLFLK